MSIVEILFRPISFFFLIPTVLILYIMMNNFVQMQPEIDSIFDSVCANPYQNIPFFNNYPLLPGQFIVQFIKPVSGFDMELKYYQSYINFINAYYNPSMSVKNADLNIGPSDPDTFITRQNYGFLRQCLNSVCICVVDSGARQFNAENFTYMSCLSTIFSYSPAKGNFTAKVNALRLSDTSNLLSDFSILNQSIFSVLSSLASDGSAEAQTIRNCYNYVSFYAPASSKVKSMKFSSSANEVAYYYDSQNPYSPNSFYDELANFYQKTQGGLMYKIVNCATIPNEESCVYTNDIKSNFLTVSDYEKVFIAFSTQNIKLTLRGILNPEYNLIEVNE